MTWMVSSSLVTKLVRPTIIRETLVVTEDLGLADNARASAGDLGFLLEEDLKVRDRDLR